MSENKLLCATSSSPSLARQGFQLWMSESPTDAFDVDITGGTGYVINPALAKGDLPYQLTSADVMHVVDALTRYTKGLPAPGTIRTCDVTSGLRNYNMLQAKEILEVIKATYM